MNRTRPSRRALLAAATTTIAATMAGCIGGAGSEDGQYAFDADPAKIPDGELTAAGYNGPPPEPFELETSLSEFGVDVDLSVTTWTAVYANPDQQSTLLVTSTPDATVLGQSVNPLVRADTVELIRRVLERMGDETDVDEDDMEAHGSESRQILGVDVPVYTFETTIEYDDPGFNTERTQVDGEIAEVEGEIAEIEGETPVYIHVATVEHDDDIVALVGVHPTVIDERDEQLALMEAIEH